MRTQLLLHDRPIGALSWRRSVEAFSTKQCWPAALWSRKDLAPAVSYSWFPFLGTRDEHTCCSRVTKNSWKHDAEGAAEPESSRVLELARQTLCSFFPLKKEHLSALRRSRDDGNCHDGDSCGWTMPTISAALTLGSRGSRGHRHLLRRHVLFGLVGPGSAVLVSVGLGHSRRFVVVSEPMGVGVS